LCLRTTASRSPTWWRSMTSTTRWVLCWQFDV
jgi:hypothetical protein